MENVTARGDLAHFSVCGELIHANDTLRSVEFVDCFRVLLVFDDWDELLVLLNDRHLLNACERI